MIKEEEIILSYLIFKEAAIAIVIVSFLISSPAINIAANFIVLSIIVTFAPY